jgi:hypothetical protein
MFFSGELKRNIQGIIGTRDARAANTLKVLKLAKWVLCRLSKICEFIEIGELVTMHDSLMVSEHAKLKS